MKIENTNVPGITESSIPTNGWLGALQGITSILGNATSGLSLYNKDPGYTVNFNNISNQAGSFNDINELKRLYSTIKPVNKKMFKPSGAEIASNALTQITSGAMAGSTFGPVGTAAGAVVGGLTALTTNLIGNSKANRQYRESLNAEDLAKNNILLNMDNTAKQQALQWQSNYSKFGGSLHTKGTIFDTDLTYIDEGGLHEDNPYGGVPISVDPEGNPNLVEEGEIILNPKNGNPYVFSNSVYAKEDILAQFGLPKKYANTSFAYIADKISKEERELPNDPINRRSLNDKMMKLTYAQEMTKAKQNKNKKQLSNIFAEGGVTSDDKTKSIFGSTSTEFKDPKKDITSERYNKWKPVGSRDTTRKILYGDKSKTFDTSKTDKSYVQTKAKEGTDAWRSKVKESSGEDPFLKGSKYWDDLDAKESNTSNILPFLTLLDEIGSLGHNLFSKFDDYGLRKVASDYPAITMPTKGNYITPEYINATPILNRNSADLARSLSVTRDVSPNRAAALASIGNITYNNTNTLGELTSKIDDINHNRKIEAIKYNNLIDQDYYKSLLSAKEVQKSITDNTFNNLYKVAALEYDYDTNKGKAISNAMGNSFISDMMHQDLLKDIEKSKKYQYSDNGITYVNNNKKKGGKLLTKRK